MQVAEHRSSKTAHAICERHFVLQGHTLLHSLYKAWIRVQQAVNRIMLFTLASGCVVPRVFPSFRSTIFLSYNTNFDWRQQAQSTMLANSINFHVTRCPIACSSRLSLLHKQVASTLSRKPLVQKPRTVRPSTSGQICRVHAMTTLSTEDASKASASGMKQVRPEQVATHLCMHASLMSVCIFCYAGWYPCRQMGYHHRYLSGFAASGRRLRSFHDRALTCCNCMPRGIKGHRSGHC